MASTNKQDDKKKNNNKYNKKAVVTSTKKTPIKKTSTRNTPVKKTPIKRTPTRNTPVKKTPNQAQNKNNNKKKKKKAVNGRVAQSPEVIPSSSSNSQEIQHSTPRRKPEKTNRKQNARNDEDEEEENGSMCKFPMARIKRIIKSEDPTLLFPQDVVFLVNKATEKFLEQFCEEAYDCCSAWDRNKALAYKHLSAVVSERRRFDFLADYVPEKLTAEIALEQRKLVGKGQVIV